MSDGKNVQRRWIASEYDIVRSSSIAESLAQLPHRTMYAIKDVRKNLRVGPPRRLWTKAEDRKLLRHRREPLRKLVRRFKNRTADSVKHRRSVIINTAKLVAWKTTDIAKLKNLYPSALHADLLAAFENRSWHAIKHQALRHGFRRAGHFTTAPNELREAVRKRAREDGISLGQLGAQTGCGVYFIDGGGKTVDLNKIARAVEFFGGRLVIDWQDA
jgi:hypothetical protein